MQEEALSVCVRFGISPKFGPQSLIFFASICQCRGGVVGALPPTPLDPGAAPEIETVISSPVVRGKPDLAHTPLPHHPLELLGDRGGEVGVALLQRLGGLDDREVVAEFLKRGDQQLDELGLFLQRAETAP